MAYHKDREITKDLPGFRRILAFLTPSRAAATIWFTQTVDVTDTLPWLEARSEQVGKKLSFLHLYMAGVGRMLHEHPNLNRYCSGHRLWQRDGVTMSVSVKKEVKEGGKIVLLKVPLMPDDTAEAIHDRFKAMLRPPRQGEEIAVEKETDFFLNFPAFVLRPAVRLINWLDRCHWLPSVFVDPDPMFTSIVCANLGSVGLNAAYHHLYEYGNSPFFSAIGRFYDAPVVVDGQVVVRKLVDVKYTFDERIEDGLACAIGLAGLKELIENPERFDTGITDLGGLAPVRV